MREKLNRHSFEKWSDQCRCFRAVWRILVRIYCTTSLHSVPTDCLYRGVRTLKRTASTGRNCMGRAQTSPAFVSLPPPLRNRTSGFLLFLVLSLWRDNVFHLLLLRLHTSFSNVSDSAAKASVTDKINRGTPELPVQLFSSHLAGYCLCAYVSELPGHLLSDAKGDQIMGIVPQVHGFDPICLVQFMLNRLC
jgi:hypothetical protein